VESNTVWLGPSELVSPVGLATVGVDGLVEGFADVLEVGLLAVVCAALPLLPITPPDDTKVDIAPRAAVLGVVES